MWLALIAGMGALVLALAKAFPEAVRTRGDWMSIAYGFGLVVVVSTGLFRLRGGAILQHLRYGLVWLALMVVLVLGYAYRDVFADARERVALGFSNEDPVVSAERELVIAATPSGAFIVVGAVNGERVRFVVDTGATETVLSPQDARRIGLDLSILQFDQAAETANGADYRSESLSVGPILFEDVQIVVNQAPLSTSLLGMSFLRRLESFEVRGDRLYMRWRDTTPQ